MTTKKLKVSKTTFPTDQPSQNEWFNELGVSKGYTKPTPYYGGNEFNTKVFLGQHRTPVVNLFGNFIYSLTKKFLWAS